MTQNGPSNRAPANLKRINLNLINGAALLCALAGSVVMGGVVQTNSNLPTGFDSEALAASKRQARTVTDAAGVHVPVRGYRRIASASLVADRLLSELVANERVVGYSRHSAKGSPWSFRFRAKAKVDPARTEDLLKLEPDLVVVNNFRDPGRVERLRASGLQVFDLGPMRGVPTLLANIRDLSTLLDVPARGERVERSFLRRMRSIARDIPKPKRHTAIYLGTHGSHIYGGTRGTSFYDVLTHAGLIDAAATNHRGWPTFTAEQVLKLNPDRIVTQTGMRRVLCAHPGFHVLNACENPERSILEVDPSLLIDPGLGMLEATEAVHAAAYN